MKTEKSRKSNSKLMDGILSLDMTGMPIGFNINGSPTYRTVLGSLISCLILVTVAGFSVIKFNTLIDRDDTNFSETLEKRR